MNEVDPTGRNDGDGITEALGTPPQVKAPEAVDGENGNGLMFGHDSQAGPYLALPTSRGVIGIPLTIKEDPSKL